MVLKKELIKAISKIQSQSTTNPCSISQVAAKHALQSEKTFLQDWLKKFESRKNLLIDFFQSISGLDPLYTSGAFYLYVSCEGFINKKLKDGKKINNDMDFAEYLLQDAKVAVVPGIGLENHHFSEYRTQHLLMI